MRYHFFLLIFSLGWSSLLDFNQFLHFSHFISESCYFFLIDFYLNIVSWLLFLKFDHHRLFLKFIHWIVILHLWDHLLFFFQLFLQIFNSVHTRSIESALTTIKVFIIRAFSVLLGLGVTNFELLFYFMNSLLGKECNFISSWKLNALFEKHFIGREEDWLFISILIFGQPLS